MGVGLGAVFGRHMQGTGKDAGPEDKETMFEASASSRPRLNMSKCCGRKPEP